MNEEELVALIEKAARGCTPWPDRLEYYYDDDGEEYERAVTLEEFVDNTWIGGARADEVFAAAAKAVDAALATSGLEK